MGQDFGDTYSNIYLLVVSKEIKRVLQQISIYEIPEKDSDALLEIVTLARMRGHESNPVLKV